MVKSKSNEKNNSVGPNLFSRDENGLLKKKEYPFNEDGSVNWRGLVKEETFISQQKLVSNER